MSKIIAVCGSPGSGKTCMAFKLSQEIYEMEKPTRVAYVSPDLNIPTLGYIFPNWKNEDLFSLGKALDRTDIYEEDIVKQFVTTKVRKDFAVLGYKLGENKYTYPALTEDKVMQFFQELSMVADYIIVDCTCDETDIISRIAKRDCDMAIQLISPDFKSVVYFSSCMNQFIVIEDKKIKVINLMDNDIFLPIEDIKKHFKGIDYIIPYSRPLKQQMITGMLSESIHDSKYRMALQKLAKAVVKPNQKDSNSEVGNGK